MANDAIVSGTVTVLPDEISKAFTLTMTVTPADTSEKWYYKKTEIQTTSANLIAGSFISQTATDQDTAPAAVTTSDTVQFLFIQNESTTDGIMICLDGGTAAFNLADGIFIGPSQTLTLRCPNTTVGNLNAISSDLADAGDAAVTAVVCALIHDV
tara:strand:- start:1475 stop:1939 length:465 start_codon:yes stop_codon:yes gene_type:complete